jgi:cyclopropane fatty-acyl-phospholipid synthase-like methyltransferase
VIEPRFGKEHYDSTAYFDGEAAAHLTDPDSAFQRYRIAKVTELAAPQPTDRVVDVGCGWGTFGFALADRVAEVVGVDFSEKSIEFCRRRLETTPRPNVQFVCADAGATGLPGGAYDLVIAADFFEHLYPDDSVRVAKEALRLLAPGGRFATWTPHRGHVLEVLKNRNIILRRDVTHVDYKSMADMRRLLSDAGFTIEGAYYTESHVPGLRIVERILGPVAPFLRRRIAVLGRKPGGSTGPGISMSGIGKKG